MDREPFLTAAVARRIALRGGLLGLALAVIPIALGDVRLALTAFVLGASYAGPSLVERVAERRAFSWRASAGWSVLAALVAYLTIVGVVAREAYLVVDPAGVRLVGLDAIDPRVFLAPLIPAWAVGVTVFHCLLRRSGALGCGVLILLEGVLGVLTLAGVLLGLWLVEGEMLAAMPAEMIVGAVILALTLTSATALGALNLIGFTLLVDGLADRR